MILLINTLISHIFKVTGFRQPTLPIGAPCGNFTGYCDIFHVCQVVDLKTPFEKLEAIYYKREGKYFM